jgi:phosphatidylserine decarboxylase
MKPHWLATKWEELRQASAIHGSFANMWSAAMGVRLSRVKIPSRRLRNIIFRTVYGKRYPPLDEHELDRPLEDFPSLNALFTRGVRQNCRPMATDPNDLAAPCDGQIQEIGRIAPDQVITVKGIDYNLESMLPGHDVRRLAGGHFAIIFLSPRDCHRVFSPYEGMLQSIGHVPGSRLLVHPPFQRRQYPVFTMNERVIMNLVTPLGAITMVLVAGWGVGHVTLTKVAGIRPRRRAVTHREMTPPVPVQRGEWLATFELGSTVILLLNPQRPLLPRMSTGASVRYGQPLWSLVHDE